MSLSPPSQQLVRAIGRWTLLGLVLNAVIGSGIFGLPAIVAEHVGMASPAACLLAALGMGLVIACFAEVSSRFHEAGGPYLYAREAFGRFVGIQMAWLAWLVRLTAAAANSNLFVIYLAQLWAPASRPLPRLIVLTLLIGGLAVINYRGVRLGANISNVFAIAKVATIVFFVAAGIFFIHPERFTPAALLEPPPGAWLDAILVLVYAFGGFESALIPVGEARDPKRDAPFAIVFALGLTTILYTLIHVVVVGVLDAPAATDRPLSAAAGVFLGPAGAAAVAAGVLVSVYGYLSAMMLNNPRLTFALGERGDFPRIFAAVHPRFRTPHVSILAFAGLVWALAVAGSFRWNLVLSAVARLFTYGATCAALWSLRNKRPGEAVLKLPAGKVFAALGVGFTALLATRMGLVELAILAGTAVIAGINWLWTRRNAQLPSAAPSREG
jgi:amino acid transporter